MQPNILLLMADQFRWDCVSAYGNSVIQTPNLDRLAHEGARFLRAYSSTPSCTPARASLLTGLGPWRHGMLGYGQVAMNYAHEMPRMIRDAGYYTTGIGKMHWHPQRNRHGFHETILDESGRAEEKGFVSDYRRWFAKVAPGKNPDATGIGWNDYASAPYALPEELHPTRWTADRAVEFLQDYNRQHPWFLKVSFARPHSPYDPPQRFMDLYRDADLPPASVGEWAARYAASGEELPSHTWRGDLGAEQVRRSRQGYYGAVSFIDEQIGRVLDVLDRRQWTDDTLILFTSDHGDMQGDHHLWRKTYAYEGSARIPMLIRPPGRRRDGMGLVLHQPVELRDVLPTFLDAAGVQSDPADFDGRSMLQLVRDDRGEWREWIDLEHSACYQDAGYWNAVVSARWKYVFFADSGREQLFDLMNDPEELTDLSASLDHGETLAAWRKRLAGHLAERGDAWVRDGELVAGRANQLYSPHYPGEA